MLTIDADAALVAETAAVLFDNDLLYFSFIWLQQEIGDKTTTNTFQTHSQSLKSKNQPKTLDHKVRWQYFKHGIGGLWHIDFNYNALNHVPVCVCAYARTQVPILFCFFFSIFRYSEQNHRAETQQLYMSCSSKRGSLLSKIRPWKTLKMSCRCLNL